MEVLDEVLESVVLPLASVDLWCFLCFLVVVWLPLASVWVCVVVVLCVVSVLGALEVEELDCAESDELVWAASLCGIVLFIEESLLAASDLVVSLLVL